MIASVLSVGWLRDYRWGNMTGHSDSSEGMPRWQQVSSRANNRFGRLGDLAKVAVIACEMLNLPLVEQAGKRDFAVILASRFSTVRQDRRYYGTLNRTEGPSPKLFPYTLPMAAIGEVSIRYGLIGEGLAICTPEWPLAVALRASIDLLLEGVPKVICLECDAVGDEEADLGLADDNCGFIGTALLLAPSVTDGAKEGGISLVPRGKGPLTTDTPSFLAALQNGEGVLVAGPNVVKSYFVNGVNPHREGTS